MPVPGSRYLRLAGTKGVIGAVVCTVATPLIAWRLQWPGLGPAEASFPVVRLVAATYFLPAAAISIAWHRGGVAQRARLARRDKRRQHTAVLGLAALVTLAAGLPWFALAGQIVTGAVFLLQASAVGWLLGRGRASMLLPCAAAGFLAALPTMLLALSGTLRQWAAMAPTYVAQLALAPTDPEPLPRVAWWWSLAGACATLVAAAALGERRVLVSRNAVRPSTRWRTLGTPTLAAVLVAVIPVPLLASQVPWQRSPQWRTAVREHRPASTPLAPCWWRSRKDDPRRHSLGLHATGGRCC